jgi:Putative MetA-pathway of phenol degradation
MNKNLLGLSALILLATPPLTAQQITTDRPGIGSGSAVLPHKTIQLEAGFDFSKDATNNTYSIGQALIRIGGPWFELEFFANSYVVTRTDFQDDVVDGEGFQDFAVGVKVPLLKDVGGRLSLSAQGILQTPSGSAIFTSDEWVPTGILLADLGLTDRLGLAVNARYQAGPGTVDDVFALIITPGVSLGGGLGAYAGWAGFFSDAGDRNFAEGGFSYLASDDLQFDLNSGWEVESGDYFLGFGFAVRHR